MAAAIQTYPSAALQARTLAARRSRMAVVETRCVLGKPCEAMLASGHKCHERFYAVTYRGRKAIKAQCYSGGHSADIPKAQDRQFFRKLRKQSRRAK